MAVTSTDRAGWVLWFCQGAHESSFGGGSGLNVWKLGSQLKVSSDWQTGRAWNSGPLGTRLMTYSLHLTSSFSPPSSIF